MLSIQKVTNYDSNNRKINIDKNNEILTQTITATKQQKTTQIVKSTNLLAYHLSFQKKAKDIEQKQINTIKSKLDDETQILLVELKNKGILSNRASNDNTSVLENLYKIATEERIQGLSNKKILSEVIKNIHTPETITQKIGDIPKEIASKISQMTNENVPINLFSSTCVVASMEYNLASKTPAEFVRFAEGLTSPRYSVDKKIKINILPKGIESLEEFQPEYKMEKDDYVSIKIKPDRNAIIRALIQTSFKDKDERSCVDVLIQSALINLGSKQTYDSINDERTPYYSNDNKGLTDNEKTYVETILFGKPKKSIIYQKIDKKGKLVGYNYKFSEIKNHILSELKRGENIIIGYTHVLENKTIDGGHEITITGYREDKQGNGYFICNDTDDFQNNLIEIREEKLLPLIHHAGVSLPLQ